MDSEDLANCQLQFETLEEVPQRRRNGQCPFALLAIGIRLRQSSQNLFLTSDVFQPGLNPLIHLNTGI